jgi:hypothetical protein
VSAELAALVILGGFVLFLVATLLVVHVVERTRTERRRRNILAQQLASDVRIQHTTDAAISQLLGVAREEMLRQAGQARFSGDRAGRGGGSYGPGNNSNASRSSHGAGYSFIDPVTIRVQQVWDEEDGRG